MLKKLIILLSLFAIENSINCAEAQSVVGINYITKISDEDLAQIQPGDTCAICLENLPRYTSNLYKSNCQQVLTMRPHIFHRDCILGSIRSGHPAAQNCPVCRGEMADLNAQNDAALIEASENGHLETVRLLLDGGANINARNNLGYTALIKASENGHLGIAHLLTDRGANINAKDNFGYTALIQASEYGHLEIVHLLLDKGADINARDNHSNTALIQASRYRRLEIVRLLLDRGTDINAKDNDGYTALMFASRHRYIEIVRLLLDKSADINAKDNDGNTALMIARQNGHQRIADLLIARGPTEHRIAECKIL